MAYAKPPITEAVIEYQFAGDCLPQDRNKIAKKFKRSYPIEERLHEMLVEGSSNGMRQSVNDIGLKLSSRDRTEIFSLSGSTKELHHAAFSVSQLAPYCGWEAFRSRFMDGWAIVEKTLGHRKLLRIGVRFINRIDIPGVIDDFGNWVRVGPVLPDQFLRPTTFTIHSVISVDSAQANLIAGVALSPLPHHSSILLDIDVYTTGEIGDRDSERTEILEDFRVKKNFIFESCITEAARGLFQ